MHYDEKLVLLLILLLTISFFFGCDNDSSVYYVQSEEQLEHLISDVRHKQEIEVLKIDGIRVIPREAFKNCSKLQQLILGNSIQVIGEDAFYGCENLAEIRWSKSLIEIGSGSFYGTGIQELRFPSECKLTIQESAFWNCTELKTVKLGEEVTCLKDTFHDCVALDSIELPPTIVLIEAEMCAKCNSLKTLFLPKSVQFVDAWPANNSGIERIVFEGTPIAVSGLVTNADEYPNLNEIIFLEGPPQQDAEQAELADLEYAPDLPFYMGDRTVTIRYLSQYRDLWSPNGETEWNGFPLKECSNIEDLLSAE